MIRINPMKKDVTVHAVVKKDLCLGCGTCVSLCPTSAIKMVKGNQTYVPYVDKDICTASGTCLKVCPGHEFDFKYFNEEIFNREPEDRILGNYLNCYTGYSNNDKIRYESSSGGLVSSLLISLLEENIIDGALVTTMKQDDPLEPKSIIARSKDEIISAAGSKYCVTPTNLLLDEIIAKPGKYAVVGLPCHLHGVRKAETVNSKIRERIVLHLGLFCGTAKTPYALEYLLYRYGIEKESVKKLSYRREGWPGKMVIHLKNGGIKEIDQLKYYDISFGSFTPWRCTLCRDGSAELSDISFGDASLRKFRSIDKIGRSIFVSRTKYGEETIQRLINLGKITAEPISAARVKVSAKDFFRQKRRLKGQFQYARLLGRKLPCYYEKPSIPTLATDYLNIFLLHSRRFLSSRQKFWRLLNIYCWLLVRLRQRYPFLNIRN